MHEILLQVLGYVRGTWRYRWWILVLAWIVAAGGWVWVAGLPDTYRASARVYVDTESVIKPLLSGMTVDTDANRRLNLMTRTLFSRDNLEKLMRMTDLDLRVKTEGQTDSMVRRIKGSIRLSASRGINIYTLSYRDRNPELALQMVKALLTLFMESSLGENRKDQDEAQRFLAQQIAEYESRLIEAERKQAEFRRTNYKILREGGGYYSRLQQNQSKLTQAMLELKIQEDRLQALRGQMEAAENDESISKDILPSPDQQVTEYTGRIAAQQSKMDDLLLRYTEMHPDVVTIRRNIQELKAKHLEELERRNASYSGTEGPVYQQLRIAFAEANANVAAKRTVVEEYKKRITNLEQAIDEVLRVEGQEKQLNRDYGLLRSQHQKLLRSRESARVTQSVDNRAGAVRFRIIEPPRKPKSPSGPPRIFYSSAFLAAGLALGAAIAFLFSLVRPTFDDRRALNEITDLPVLGSVSMVWTERQISLRRRRHAAFLSGLIALVAAYGLVLGAHQYGIDWLNEIGKLRTIAGI